MAVNSVDNTDKQIGSVNLNPLGQGGDFIAFPVVGEVGYSGQNALGALLSEGWWSGGATFTGDISVFSRTATYLVDVPQFLRRYLRSMRDVQREDGRFPDIAPLGGGFGGLLWGSAGITVPWECYLQYGDKVLLAEHYDAMKRYISYILDKTIDPKTNILL